MVEFQPYGGQQAVQDPFDFINQGGVKGLAFAVKDSYGRSIDLPVGTGYTVRTTAVPDVMQQRDFETGEPKFYKDNNPMMMLRVLVDTDPNEVPRESPEDDGTRALYFRNQMLRALQDEMRRNGVKQFGVGTVMRVTLVDLKNTGKGNPQKLYAVQFAQVTPHSNPVADQVLAGTQGQAQQQLPPQQQVAYQPPPVQQFAAPLAQQAGFPQQAQPIQQPPVQQFPPQQFAAPPVQQFAAPPVQQAPPQAPPVQQFGVPAVQAVFPGAVEVQPQEPVPGSTANIPQVTQEMISAVNLLINNGGFTREAALAAFTKNDAALIAALEPHIPF